MDPDKHIEQVRNTLAKRTLPALTISLGAREKTPGDASSATRSMNDDFFLVCQPSFCYLLQDKQKTIE